MQSYHAQNLRFKVPQDRLQHRGQSTVEFALILPLAFACAVVVLITGVLVHDQLALSETARITVRSAVVSDEPETAASAIAQQVDPNIRITTNVNTEVGIVTVVLEKSRRLPLFFFQSLMPEINLSAKAAMALEPPLVIG